MLWREIAMGLLPEEDIKKLSEMFPITVADQDQSYSENENEGSDFEKLFLNDLSSILLNGEYSGSVKEVLINSDCCTSNCIEKLKTNNLDRLKIYMSQSRELNKENKISFLLGLINVGLEKGEKGKRNYYKFIYRHDTFICREAFLKIHGISVKSLRRLQAVASSGALFIPAHGNTGNKPPHSLSEDTKKNIFNFLEKIKQTHALPMPGGLSKNSSANYMLPVNLNYSRVYKIYSEGNTNGETVSYRTFIKIWQSGFPNLLVGSPKSDLCDLCVDLRNRLTRSQNENKIKEINEEFAKHIESYETARKLYKKETKKSKKCWKSLDNRRRIYKDTYRSKKSIKKERKQNFREIEIHYSFDYAQSVYYPYSPQQRSSAYFLSPRKCELFGIVNDATKTQVLFTIDEFEYVGKGVSEVISYIDTYFNYYGLGEKIARFHADNCASQNKNNFVIWYLMWRVMSGQHDEISISFLVTGHTKFSPDSFFGMFKRQYQVQDIDWIDDVIDCVKSSTTKGQIIPQPYGVMLGKKPLFQFRDWKSFLSKHFKKLPGITKYNRFEFSKEFPGKVCVLSEGKREYINLLKNENKRFNGRGRLPRIKKPKKVDKERQEYLYKKVRHLVKDSTKADNCCPKPKGMK